MEAKIATNDFEKLVKYTKNVYDIERGFSKIQDDGVNPTCDTSTVILVIIFGFFMRLRSFNEIDNYVRRGDFTSLVAKGTTIPRVDTLRDTLKVTYMEGITKNGGEITATKRLVTNVFERKNHFIDVIAYDSLVCNSIFINHCTQYKIDVIIRAKNNKNNAVRKVKKKINKQAPVEVWTQDKEFEKVEVYETEFEMPGVERLLRNLLIHLPF